MSTAAQAVKRWSRDGIWSCAQYEIACPQEFVSAEDYTALEREKAKQEAINGLLQRQLDALPFCPDCRDKVRHESCPRCRYQTAEAKVTALERRVQELEHELAILTVVTVTTSHSGVARS